MIALALWILVLPLDEQRVFVGYPVLGPEAIDCPYTSQSGACFSDWESEPFTTIEGN
jgi:hypothetical protein